MIELVLIICIVPQRIFRLAPQRGESRLFWTILAIGAWIGAELVILVSSVTTLVY